MVLKLFGHPEIQNPSNTDSSNPIDGKFIITAT